MKKPDDFWPGVAADVCRTTNAMNDSVPTWDQLDEPGQNSMILICQLAVKFAAARGKALLPYEPEPEKVA